MYSIIILFCYCSVIVGNTLIQIPSPFSKSGRLRRSLIVQLNLSAKTTPYELFLEKNLILFFYLESLEKYCCRVRYRDQSRLNLVFFFNLSNYFRKHLFLFELFLILSGTVQPNFEKLSMITKTYLYLLLFSGPQSLRSKMSKLQMSSM